MQSTAEQWALQLRDRLQAAGVYFGHGTDNALDEAVWMLLHVLQQPLDGSFDQWDMPVTQAQASELEQLLSQRIETRQPLAYLLGQAWFCGLEFAVSPDVLVPRSPLAELIPVGFSPWLVPSTDVRALDLCTGSGCIAIAMAHYQPGWQVTGSDISEAALQTAHANVRRHHVQDRVQLVRSDLFAALQGQRFDLIVSNPPYVGRDEMAQLPDEYLAEPELGLVSGDDGLDIPLRILLHAPDYLSDEGVLLCEVGNAEAALVQALPEAALTWLEFEHGGGGVFTIDAEQLRECREAVGTLLESRKNVL